MAYVAVKGGKEAIEKSLERLEYLRTKDQLLLDVKTIRSNLRLHLAHVMSEASLYDEELAALAIKQGEGSIEEAVFLLRAFRSTLPRKHYSTNIETSEMDIKRRISASFKDIPGGQLLGASYDYSHRMLDFKLLDETLSSPSLSIQKFYDDVSQTMRETTLHLPKVSNYLRSIGFLQHMPIQTNRPKDITKHHLTFPTERPERLQILTRGMTQSVITFGYASLRGYGSVHPTVGELRVGNLPIYINPLNTLDDDNYYIGDFEATEVESFVPVTTTNKDGQKKIHFDIGYGFCFGQNETKAIAMSILDQTLTKKDATYPTGNEEFVLFHIDAVEATGFISHLKLPHYVTFQSKLSDMRKATGLSHE